MKITKIILSIITMLFAVLGLVKFLPFDIANPIMLVSLATLLLLRSVEYKNNRVILSRLVDTFSSRILYPMLLLSGKHSIAVA